MGLPDGPLLDAVRAAAARAHAAQNDVSRLQEVADGKLARLQATHDAERALRRRAEAEVAVLGRCLRDAEAFHALREVQADVRAAKQAQQAQALRAVLEHQSRAGAHARVAKLEFEREQLLLRLARLEEQRSALRSQQQQQQQLLQLQREQLQREQLQREQLQQQAVRPRLEHEHVPRAPAEAVAKEERLEADGCDGTASAVANVAELKVAELEAALALARGEAALLAQRCGAQQALPSGSAASTGEASEAEPAEAAEAAPAPRGSSAAPALEASGPGGAPPTALTPALTEGGSCDSARSEVSLEVKGEVQGLREQLERVMARFASQPAERESGRADGADGTGGGAMGEAFSCVEGEIEQLELALQLATKYASLTPVLQAQSARLSSSRLSSSSSTPRGRATPGSSASEGSLAGTSLASRSSAVPPMAMR
ncbi:hypothetical protein EMIHUDRAFT_113041 [Emiliania huxleyi CCMP1516]|uniref:Uncharacterized protein n=2 Tax=Emiliania huxleyi TaxID=2903 RepID=A0A0D3K4T2_EMIH1|nr:hypothetical protein EMIHUDRAFT_113041 [Emiliania huxleyi CCMP1516]EOD30767.1 hypothetical protein EMIHUDRAFT_113041 [Emiliania huxleyi CCMP1516]|eukprot:XP_005783196.1 hypothetical protein EMIHUDRAFT_113041 [Emiliania huxleyi CCMP1516]